MSDLHVRTARPDPRLGVVRRYTVHANGSFAGWVNRIPLVNGRVRFRDAVHALVQETLR